MRIAVDFDGTIVKHEFPKIGEEIPHAFETLLRLKKNGHQLILWTYRWGEYLDEAVEFCRKNGLVFYAINQNHPGENFDLNEMSRKIDADLYIDDRNIGGLRRWDDIYDLIKSGETGQKTTNYLIYKWISIFLTVSLIILLASSPFISIRVQTLLWNNDGNDKKTINNLETISLQHDERDGQIKEDLESLTQLIGKLENQVSQINYPKDESFSNTSSVLTDELGEPFPQQNGEEPKVKPAGIGIPGKFPEASARLLTSKDLTDKTIDELSLMRNEIFARHYQIFNDSKWSSYFEKQLWYTPKYESVKEKLSPIEAINFQLIIFFENK